MAGLFPKPFQITATLYPEHERRTNLTGKLVILRGNKQNNKGFGIRPHKEDPNPTPQASLSVVATR